MSVRRIPARGRGVRGFVASAKTRQMVGVESTLERDFATLLEFDAGVVRYDAQPLRLEYRGPRGDVRRGVPDFYIEYDDRLGRPPLLCDVKYRNELFERWCEYKPRLRAAMAYAWQRGWKYQIMTEVEIRTPVLQNAKFLLPFRRHEPDREHTAVLIAALKRLGTISVGALLSEFDDDPDYRAELVPTLWHHLSQSTIVSACLTEPLTLNTELLLRRETP